MISIPSVARMLTEPEFPVPMVVEPIDAPPSILNRPVNKVVSPPRPEPKLKLVMALTLIGLVGANPVISVDSVVFRVMSPP